MARVNLTQQQFTVGLIVGSTPQLLSGAGSPEASVTATPGSVYLRDTGGSTATLYIKESGSGNTGWVPYSSVVTAGGSFLDPTGARDVMVWRAPYACTVTNVRGHRKGGTGATVNARRNQGGTNHLASALSLTSADTWMDGGSVQDATYAAGDDLEIRVISVAGSPTEVSVQVDFVRKS
jgi:hypothetical protein